MVGVEARCHHVKIICLYKINLVLLFGEIFR